MLMFELYMADARHKKPQGQQWLLKLLAQDEGNYDKISR
jgi:hypothetical protein